MQTKKILIILLLIVLLINIFSISSYAATPTIQYDEPIGPNPQSALDDVIGSADNFINQGKQGADEKYNQLQLQNVSGSVYNIFLGIGIVLAVVIGGVLGIQFMLASAEGKAEAKEKLIPFAIGCVIIFGSFAIWRIAVILLSGLS